MIRIVSFTLLMLAPCFMLGSNLAVADDVDISAELRARGEYLDTDFNSDTDAFSFGLLRSRFNLKFEANEKVTGFIQVQDGRYFGESGLHSGLTLDDDENLGLHQAYAMIKDPFVENLYFKFGRFEYSKGNERLFGAVGWTNFGRSFDGVVIGYKAPTVDIQLVGFQLNERYVSSNDDRILLAIYAGLQKTDVDFFIVWDRDDFRDSENNRMLSRVTFGLYRYGEFDNFDYTTNAAYQTGNTMFEALDIAAYMVAIDIGYTTDDERFRVGGGIDLTSGDDDSEDDKSKTFDNLYYTGHKFRGHMDFFVTQPSYGLNDFYLTGAFRPDKNTSVELHGHLFMSNVDFTTIAEDGSSDKSSSIGQEIDAFVKQQLYDDFSWQLGASMFFPSEDWRGPDADPAYWLYLMTTASFR